MTPYRPRPGDRTLLSAAEGLLPVEVVAADQRGFAVVAESSPAGPRFIHLASVHDLLPDPDCPADTPHLAAAPR